MIARRRWGIHLAGLQIPVRRRCARRSGPLTPALRAGSPPRARVFCHLLHLHSRRPGGYPTTVTRSWGRTDVHTLGSGRRATLIASDLWTPW